MDPNTQNQNVNQQQPGQGGTDEGGQWRNPMGTPQQSPTPPTAGPGVTPPPPPGVPGAQAPMGEPQTPPPPPPGPMPQAPVPGVNEEPEDTEGQDADEGTPPPAPAM